MKKKIFGIMVMAMALVATPAFAQKNNTKAKKEVRTERQMSPRGEAGFAAALFDGINLTDAQKNQLKELREKQREQRKAKMQAYKEQFKEMKQDEKANRGRRDSTMMAARKAERQDYLNSLKSILGEENYVKFLENSFLNAPSQDFGRQGAPRRGDKDMRVRGDKKAPRR